MSHHSYEDLSQGMKEALGLPDDLGATGKFPMGKLNDDDEGEIKIAIGHQDGKVVLDFGTPIHWIGFTPSQAIEIVEALRDHAFAAKGITT